MDAESKFRLHRVPTLHTFERPRYPKNKKYLKKRDDDAIITSRTKISFKLARPEEPEFYSTGPGLEEEQVQSLKEATRPLNSVDPILKKRLFNHTAGMEIKVVTSFNSNSRGEDDAEDDH